VYTRELLTIHLVSWNAFVTSLQVEEELIEKILRRLNPKARSVTCYYSTVSAGDCIDSGF